MKFLYVAMLGDVEPDIPRALEPILWQNYGFQVRTLNAGIDPESAFDARRGQYGSVDLMRLLLARCPSDAAKVLGLTGKDLFIPMLSFLYGQAQLGGIGALVSVARLRQEFYGLPPRPALLLDRIRKEAMHELGHAFGLIHCQEPGCVMSLSTNLAQVDLKREKYCQGCGVLLAEAIHSIPGRT